MTVLLAVLAAILLLLTIAAAYFFRYTFTRTEKKEPWARELENTVLKDRGFFEQRGRELLELRSRDGLKLKAWFYDRGSKTTVILCHGYRGGPEELSGIASYLYKKGMNILLIYHRAHGLSEGKSFTMGGKEKLDAVDWAREIARRRPEGKIVLFGWSMGGNTVMGAVGEELPGNVVCAVEDCGYENLRDQLLFSCQGSMPRLPAKRLFIGLLDLHCRLFHGFSLNEPRAAALARCGIPMLFIHGAKDTVVPFENLKRCYGACASKKLRSAYARAGHVGACGSETERYFGELCAFINSSVKQEEKHGS